MLEIHVKGGNVFLRSKHWVLYIAVGSVKMVYSFLEIIGNTSES